MNKHVYQLVDNQGYELDTLVSSHTNLSYDEYFDKYFRQLLKLLSISHGKAVLLAVD